MNGTRQNGTSNGFGRALKRYVATWEFNPQQPDELELRRGDILLVADEFCDGWKRGLRLSDLTIGFFPSNFVAEDVSPVYQLRDIKLTSDHYINDPKFLEFDSSKRSKIALEIFTSEEAYLKKLRMLVQRFVVPLSQNGAINPEDYGPVFSNIEPLLSLAESLTLQLRSRMEGWDERVTRIGDIFIHMGHHLKLYVSYAIQHTLGSQILVKISLQERFRAWLEKTEVDCQRTLNSLLLEPIQRVPRYELLMKDLLKHTSEDHPDYASVETALVVVQRTASDINEQIRRAENELKLFAISKRFPHEDVDIVTAKKFLRPKDITKRRNSASLSKRPNGMKKRPSIAIIPEDSSLSFRTFFESEHQRVFAKEGMLQKCKPDFTDPSERYVFLCSDALLIAQPTSKSHKTFKLKERVLLVHTWVADSLMGSVTIPDQGFILGTPLRMYQFMASSLEEKDEWFSKLRSLIFAQKKLFNKLLSHLSIPDESFLCCTAKVKVNYLAMLDSELSFKLGDEVSIMGFKDPLGKWRPGLYVQEPFDPCTEWYFGILKGRVDSYGWFPIACIQGLEGKPLEPAQEELYTAPMCSVLGLKQRMIEVTGRVVPPLTENERMAKVYLGEGNFKTLRVPPQCAVDDVVRMYFKVKPDRSLSWTLVEQSVDGTVHRVMEAAEEDPSSVVDFWGKSRDQMRFLLKQTIMNHHTGDSEA